MERLRAMFGVSERRASGVAGQRRSTQRKQVQNRVGVERALRARLREISRGGSAVGLA